MKRNVMKCSVSGNNLTWDFGPNASPLTINAGGLTDEIRQMALVHGIRQKVQDAAALDYRQPDGTIRKPTVAEKHQRMAEMIDRLERGFWFVEDRAEPNATGLLAALQVVADEDERYAAFADMTPDTFRDWADGKATELTRKNGVETGRKAIYAALRKQEKVAAALARLATGGGIDVDDILGE